MEPKHSQLWLQLWSGMAANGLVQGLSGKVANSLHLLRNIYIGQSSHLPHWMKVFRVGQGSHWLGIQGSWHFNIDFHPLLQFSLEGLHWLALPYLSWDLIPYNGSPYHEWLASYWSHCYWYYQVALSWASSPWQLKPAIHMYRTSVGSDSPDL